MAPSPCSTFFLSLFQSFSDCKNISGQFNRMRYLNANVYKYMYKQKLFDKNICLLNKPFNFLVNSVIFF